MSEMSLQDEEIFNTNYFDLSTFIYKGNRNLLCGL